MSWKSPDVTLHAYGWVAIAVMAILALDVIQTLLGLALLVLSFFGARP